MRVKLSSQLPPRFALRRHASSPWLNGSFALALARTNCDSLFFATCCCFYLERKAKRLLAPCTPLMKNAVVPCCPRASELCMRLTEPRSWDGHGSASQFRQEASKPADCQSYLLNPVPEGTRGRVGDKTGSTAPHTTLMCWRLELQESEGRINNMTKCKMLSQFYQVRSRKLIW